MYESTINSMLGIVPVAMTGGLAMGMTNKMMQMTTDEPMRYKKRKKKYVKFERRKIYIPGIG